MSARTQSIVDAVAGVAGGKAQLHVPEIAGNEWAYVKECLDTEWVSTVGSYVTKFETDLAGIVGCKHAVATASGTAALHVCLILAGVEPGDEVIVPALTFVATANAVAYQHAVPHFADCETATLGIDAAKLRRHLEETAEVTNAGCRNKKTGRQIRALVCMHVFGHPSDIDGLVALCDEWKLVLVEDAAESLGSYYHDRHTGTFGRIAAISFNGNKIVTTGGGGAVMTDDDELARRAKHLTTTAKLPHAWEFVHDEVGYNYRLPNICAAMGCAQLERLDDFLARKRLIAERYANAFATMPGVAFHAEPADCRSNYWLNCIMLDDADMTRRDDVLAALNGHGLMSRPAWTPMHMLAIFADCPRDDLAVTEQVHKRLISLPSSPRLAGNAGT